MFCFTYMGWPAVPSMSSVGGKRLGMNFYRSNLNKHFVPKIVKKKKTAKNKKCLKVRQKIGNQENSKFFQNLNSKFKN